MWQIFFVQLIGLVSPGPDFFYVCRKAMADSRRNAMLGAIGIALGVGFWAIVVLFGLAFLNRIVPSFQLYLMVLGGSYLAYCGSKMVRVTKSTEIEETVQSSQATQSSIWKEILSGLMINLSNPKVIVFFSSVLAGYVSNLSALSDMLAVLAILVGSTLIWFWIVAILFSQKKIRRFYAKHNRYLDNAAGIVFIFFGCTLIFEGIQGIF